MSYEGKEAVKPLTIEQHMERARVNHFMSHRCQEDAFELLEADDNGLVNLAEFMIVELGMPMSMLIGEIRGKKALKKKLKMFESIRLADTPKPSARVPMRDRRSRKFTPQPTR